MSPAAVTMVFTNSNFPSSRFRNTSDSFHLSPPKSVLLIKSSCSICSGLCRTERAASRRRCSLRVHSQSSRNATEITSQHRKPLKRRVGIIDTSVWIMKRCFCFFVNPAEAFRSSSNNLYMQTDRVHRRRIVYLSHHKLYRV